MLCIFVRMKTTGSGLELIACLDCDLLQRRVGLECGQQARCIACDALLYERKRGSGERTLALALAGLALFVVANTQAFITLSLEGREQSSTILSGVFELFDLRFFALGALVLFSIFLAPLALNLGLIYVLLPERPGFRLPFRERVLQSIERLRPFAMLEVFLLGVVVSLVKLRELASIALEPGFWSLVALIAVTAVAFASLDTHRLWNRLEQET